MEKSEKPNAARRALLAKLLAGGSTIYAAPLIASLGVTPAMAKKAKESSDGGPVRGGGTENRPDTPGSQGRGPENRPAEPGDGGRGSGKPDDPAESSDGGGDDPAESSDGGGDNPAESSDGGGDDPAESSDGGGETPAESSDGT